MNAVEAINYIHSVTWMGSRPGLDRISELCHAMGDPQSSLRVIHVAGTNGKGSFCSMLSSILRESGYRVGLFTSPYVLEFGERIQLDGEMISGEDLAEVTEYVKGFADKMADPPTEFELLSAIAFEYFKRKSCDFVVLEAGLGGRLDSTNVISESVLSVITGISLDHTGVLGDTIEKIAAEKAGIIKEGCPVLVGAVEASVLDVIAGRAEECHAPLFEVEYDGIRDETFSLDGTSFLLDGEAYKLSLLGAYQVRNAAAVLSAVKALRSRDVDIPETAVKRGLEKAAWRARFELIHKNPTVVYDGAHNPEGVLASVKNIRLVFGDVKPVLLVGVMADKDHSFMTETLASVAASVHTVTPDNPRAMSADALAAEFLALGVSATPHKELSSGVAAAMREADALGAPMVALGSLYMYAEVLPAVISFGK